MAVVIPICCSCCAMHVYFTVALLSSVVRPSSAGSARPGSAGSAASRPGSSGSSRRAPPIQRADSAGSSGRRTPSTPTKQVTLQAVPRKQDRSVDVGEFLLTLTDRMIFKRETSCVAPNTRKTCIWRPDRKVVKRSSLNSARPVSFCCCG